MKTKKFVARILTMAMALCLVLALAVPAMATTFNEKIVEAKNGVVQIEIWYIDQEMADEVWIGSGTGFLINEDTVITCNHVITGFSDEWYAERAVETSAILGRDRTAAELKENLELRISVLRDVHVRATVRQSSTEMDFAILTLNDKLYNRSTLKLRSSETLTQTEAVYALGFPSNVESLSDQVYHDADDVTITTGTVNKVGRSSFNTTETIDGVTFITGVYENVDCVEHSAAIAGGNSGGPLVDAEGNVVGINAAGDSTHTVNIAIAVDQLMDTMDALGIEYEKADSAPAATEPPATEAPQPVATEPPATEAPQPVATEPPATQPVVQEPAPSNNMIIIIVAIVAVVAVVLVVVIVMSKGKKNAAPAPVSGGYTPPAPPRASNPSNGGFTSAPPTPAYGGMDAGETSVLTQDAGETTVLSRNVSGGTLIRKRSGETISINAERFVIGRERKTVNYCVADNSSISRNHVTLSVRGGVTYLTDMNAANGTYVNGVKVMPRQEVALKSGDKITLSDEEFEFRG